MTQRNSRPIGIGILALFGLVSAWLAVAPARGGPAYGIEWRTDLRRAVAEAESKNRLLWLQFTGPWCHFCNLMDRESFVHPKVVGQSRDHFVPVKLQSEEHEDLASRFGISGLPATVIVTGTGEVIAKHEGYVDGETFHGFLQSAKSRFQVASHATMPPPRVAAPPPPVRPAPPALTVAAQPARRVEVSVALAGYCPVSLVQDHRLVPGKDAVSLNHEGRVYRFANPRVRGAFQRQPERFIPVNGGRCPVTQVELGDFKAGDPRYGILYQGHLYLCADEAKRSLFLKNPERYSHVDLAERGLCAHCWGHDYLRAKGQPQWTPPAVDFRFVAAGRETLDASRSRGDTARR